jgi:hypothetical protein
MLEYILNNYFMLLYFLALILSIAKYHLYYDTILKYLPILIVYILNRNPRYYYTRCR